jgi:hypothetical protein
MSDWGEKIDGGWFNEKGHVYRCDEGIVRPSTTQTFSILGIDVTKGIPQADLDWKRDYGIACHKAVEYMVQGDLDWEGLDEKIVPAVTGIEAFLKEREFRLITAEKKMIGNLHGMKYGLQIDLLGWIKHGGVERKAIIDLKSGVKFSPTWNWQVGGYIASQPPEGLLGVIAQFDKGGRVKSHYVDAVRAQREFQILLAAAILKLNAFGG